MFGKGQGVLGAWFKEFCQLVFIQTLQAFIYAIIISFVIQIMMKDTAASVNDATDYRTGLGLICVFAMVSVFKVEDIVRKVFGFGPTKADHGGAVRSIAKTAFAMQLGKRVLDNGRKVFGGAGKLIKANKDASKARKRLEEDKADLYGDMGIGGGTAGSSGSSDFIGTGGSGGTSGYGSFASSSSSNSSKNYNQRIRAISRENEKALSEIKKQRSEALKDIASGVLESGGALYGATAGAIIGGADGDLDGAIQGTMAGAGLGDAAGKAVVNVADVGIQTVKGGVSIIRETGKAIGNVHEYRKEYKHSGERRATIKAISKEYNSRFNQINQLSRELDELKERMKGKNSKVEDTND